MSLLRFGLIDDNESAIRHFITGFSRPLCGSVVGTQCMSVGQCHGRWQVRLSMLMVDDVVFAAAARVATLTTCLDVAMSLVKVGMETGCFSAMLNTSCASQFVIQKHKLSRTKRGIHEMVTFPQS